MAYLGFYFGGEGVQNIFGKVGVFAWLCIVLHARGVRGYAPPRKFLKMVNLVRFGEYFAKIL